MQPEFVEVYLNRRGVPMMRKASMTEPSRTTPRLLRRSQDLLRPTTVLPGCLRPAQMQDIAMRAKRSRMRLVPVSWANGRTQTIWTPSPQHMPISGQFDEAVKWQTRGIGMLTAGDYRIATQSCLEAYKAAKRYRRGSLSGYRSSAKPVGSVHHPGRQGRRGRFVRPGRYQRRL
jgi:hypothetical protein